jgi:ParB-like chromosome segregation protein Spo0J
MMNRNGKPVGVSPESRSAIDLLVHNRRMDLIIKYEYARSLANGYDASFFSQLYLAHIKAFNNYLEPPEKTSPNDFVRSFRHTFESLKRNGFDLRLGAIPVDDEHQLLDGAHRTASCAALGIDVPVFVRQRASETRTYDYAFFRRHGLPETFADYAALELVRNNPKAKIVTLHAVNPPAVDQRVEAVLNSHGMVFYRKPCHLSFNGYVNLKRLSYAGEAWIGSELNGFNGARKHAELSFGPNPLRAYVFICEDANDAANAKKEIRSFLGRGEKATIHITDTHAEAIRLSESLFNDNSLFALNARAYELVSHELDDRLRTLGELLADGGFDQQSVCITGSSPLQVFGIRKSRDLDFLAINAIKIPDRHRKAISSHDGELRHYAASKQDLVLDPRNHFHYEGFKFITLDVLAAMKKNRAERPKDFYDRKLIVEFRRKHFRTAILGLRRRASTMKTAVRGLVFTMRRNRYWHF